MLPTICTEQTSSRRRFIPGPFVSHRSRDRSSVSRETASLGYWKSLRKYERYVLCAHPKALAVPDASPGESAANGIRGEKRSRENPPSAVNIFSGVPLENIVLVI